MVFNILYTHTLPPPTLPHPVHYWLVNLFKTPICLSELSGSFQWLRVSPGTTEPLCSASLTQLSISGQPVFCSASVRRSRQWPHDLLASRLYSCCASLAEHPPFLPSATANSHQRTTVKTRKTESNSLPPPATSVNSRQAEFFDIQATHRSMIEEFARDVKQEVSLSRL